MPRARAGIPCRQSKPGNRATSGSDPNKKWPRHSLRPGQTVAPNDLWIATCAIHHSVALLTNNRKHFEMIPDLQLVPVESE